MWRMALAAWMLSFFFPYFPDTCLTRGRSPLADHIVRGYGGMMMPGSRMEARAFSDKATWIRLGIAPF